MKYKYLYLMWAGMYVLCAGLGFVPADQSPVYWLLFFISCLFFVPPGWILAQAIRQKNRKQVKAVWIISLAWLILTVVLLVINFMTVGSSQAVGTAMYYLLTALASPMICSQVWVVPMFLFGCLLTASWQQLRKR